MVKGGAGRADRGDGRRRARSGRRDPHRRGRRAHRRHATAASPASSSTTAPRSPRDGGDLERRSEAHVSQPRRSGRSRSRVPHQIRNYRMPGTRREAQLRPRRLPAFRGVRERRRDLRGRIHIGPTIDYLERAFDASKYGEISRRAVSRHHVPVAPRSVAGARRAARDVGLRAVRAVQAGARDAPGPMRDSAGHDGAADARALRAGHRSPDRGQQVITPADLEATYGLTGGHIFHGEPSLDQLFTMRPVLGLGAVPHADRRTVPVRPGTHPGGGLTAASGQNAAREIIKERSRSVRASVAPDGPIACAPRFGARCAILVIALRTASATLAAPSRVAGRSASRRSRATAAGRPRAPLPGAAVRRRGSAQTHRVPRRQAAPRRIAARSRARRLRSATGSRPPASRTSRSPRTRCCCPGPRRPRSRWWRREPWRAVDARGSDRRRSLHADFASEQAGLPYHAYSASGDVTAPRRLRRQRQPGRTTTVSRRMGIDVAGQDRPRPLFGAVQLSRLQGADRAAARRRRHPDLLRSGRRRRRRRGRRIRTARGDRTATSSAAASSTTSWCRAIR